ncbi:MAG: prepilin-type N-terminal cleavage/methylation domain-containing protein [Planctomycetota bacterium]
MNYLLNQTRRAFTFIEVAVVIIIIGILAAMVVPKFSSVTDDAKAASVQGTLGGVRAAIAGFRTSALLSSKPPFPTLVELNTLGTVLQQPVPANPFTNQTAVQIVSALAAANRTTSNESSYGWNYFVDNSSTPPTAIFYANSTATTTVKNAAGAFLTANKL